MKRILIAEDEPKLAALLIDYLERFGFSTHWVDDGAEVMTNFRTYEPDLILLDLMLPNRDGMDICRELRKCSEVPVIMVTARVEEIDRILGLELGADDYICKPFSPREVVARVKSVLRRMVPSDAVDSRATRQRLMIDEAAYEVTADGTEVALTPQEFHLLKAMAAQPHRVFSRNQLIDKMYDDGRIVSDRTVDTYIKNLRKKLAVPLHNDEVIASVYGVGYKYVPPE